MKPIVSYAAVSRRFGERRLQLQSRFLGWLVLLSVVSFLIACGSSTAPSSIEHGMRLGASAHLVQSVAGDSVQAVLTVQNVADSVQHISWANCPSNGPLLLLASKASGNRFPVWNSQDEYSKVICVAILLGKDLGPGESWQYAFAVPVATILGDSLPAGSYSFDVSAKYLAPGFSEEIPAGTLTLAPQ